MYMEARFASYCSCLLVDSTQLKAWQIPKLTLHCGMLDITLKITQKVILIRGIEDKRPLAYSDKPRCWWHACCTTMLSPPVVSHASDQLIESVAQELGVQELDAQELRAPGQQFVR